MTGNRENKLKEISEEAELLIDSGVKLVTTICMLIFGYLPLIIAYNTLILYPNFLSYIFYIIPILMIPLLFAFFKCFMSILQFKRIVSSYRESRKTLG